MQQTTGDGNLGLDAIGAAVSVTSIQNNTQAYVGNYGTPPGRRRQFRSRHAIRTTSRRTSPASPAPRALRRSSQHRHLEPHQQHDGAAAKQRRDLDVAGAVTIAANQQSNVDVPGRGISGRIAWRSARWLHRQMSTPTSTPRGRRSDLGTTVGKVGSLSVLTTTGNTVNASALRGLRRRGGGSYGQATATVTLAGAADIGGASVHAAARGHRQRRLSTQSVTATSNELSPGVVAGLGGSRAHRQGSGDRSPPAWPTGLRSAAGSLSVTAQSTDTAATDAQAFGTGLVTRAGADAESDVNVDTEAYVGAANITLSGSANVNATAKDTVTANSGKLPQNLLQPIFGSSGNFGALASGSVIAKATVESPIKAHIDDANINAGGGVSVSATGTDQTTATTYCLTFGGDLRRSEQQRHRHGDPRSRCLDQRSQVQTGGDVDVTADAETAASASVDSGSLGIVAAGPSDSNATDSPAVNAYIGANSSTDAGGKIIIQGIA